MKKSEAKKIDILFKKYKKTWKSHYETANFKEPTLILMRRGNKAEFYEDAKSGEFKFTHSDGTERYILLNPKNLQTFPYGNKSFRGYITHEDFPLALPEEPTVTSELFNISINKTLNDIKKWKAEEFKAKGEMFKQILWGVAIIIGAITLYVMLKPNPATAPPPQIVHTAAKAAAETIAENVSAIVM